MQSIEPNEYDASQVIMTHRQSPQGEEAVVSTNYVTDSLNSMSIAYKPPPDYPGYKSTAGQQCAPVSTVPKSTTLHHNVYNSTLVPAHQSALLTGGLPAYNNGEQIHSQPDDLLPPPPEYPGPRSDIRRSYEVLDRQNVASQSQSLSQPELSQSHNGATSIHPNHTGHVTHTVTKTIDQHDFAAVAARASKMVEILSEENKQLRSEIEGYYRKVSRLQKFELELQKALEAHETLVKSSAKRETLERAIRSKQELDIKQLEFKNQQLQDEIKRLETQSSHSVTQPSLQSIIKQQEQTISTLNHKLQSQSEEMKVLQHQVTYFQQDFANEKIITQKLQQELEAYKTDATTMIEEESEMRMAALQQNTKDSERIIQQAHSEKLKYMDAAHSASKQIALLESRLRSVEASCAEKDAVIRVLQRRQRSNLSGRGQPPSIEPMDHQRIPSDPTSLSNSQSTPSISLINQSNLTSTSSNQSNPALNSHSPPGPTQEPSVVTELWQV